MPTTDELQTQIDSLAASIAAMQAAIRDAGTHQLVATLAARGAQQAALAAAAETMAIDARLKVIEAKP